MSYFLLVQCANVVLSHFRIEMSMYCGVHQEAFWTSAIARLIVAIELADVKSNQRLLGDSRHICEEGQRSYTQC